MGRIMVAAVLAVSAACWAGCGDFKDGKTGIEMVFVKGGAFKMGCTDEQKECEDDEKPTHNVTLGDFHIGKYEVTQKQWYQVMGSNPSSGEEGENLPVTVVSWKDVQTFIERLNTMTGRAYRLPTEAEWEFAARGGSKSKGYEYSGGNSIGSVAWYNVNSGDKALSEGLLDEHLKKGDLNGYRKTMESNKNRTHPIGTKAPNELGLYDMSGNVWEWVGDWYDKYSSFDIADPKGPTSGSNRVRRGGGWSYDARFCRVSFRGYGSPDYRNYDLGFRLAVSP